MEGYSQHPEILLVLSGDLDSDRHLAADTQLQWNFADIQAI